MSMLYRQRGHCEGQPNAVCPALGTQCRPQGALAGETGCVRAHSPLLPSPTAPPPADYMTKETFKKNFWEGFSEVLGPKHAIQCLTKCDFTPIYEWHMAERERKRALTKEVGVSGWEVGGRARQEREGCGWVLQHNHE